MFQDLHQVHQKLIEEDSDIAADTEFWNDTTTLIFLLGVMFLLLNEI